VRWSDGKTASKLVPTKIFPHRSVHDPKFMWQNFTHLEPEEQEKALRQEDMGIHMFLEAYRDNDFKAMEKSTYKI
jgi:hypothetical protein